MFGGWYKVLGSGSRLRVLWTQLAIKVFSAEMLTSLVYMESDSITVRSAKGEVGGLYQISLFTNLGNISPVRGMSRTPGMERENVTA